MSDCPGCGERDMRVREVGGIIFLLCQWCARVYWCTAEPIAPPSGRRSRATFLYTTLPSEERKRNVDRAE